MRPASAMGATERRPSVVAYSFRKQFAEPILAGTKGGTIRADRRRHARPGEELQLYIGMRTKHCRLIARKTCIIAQPIRLQFHTLRGDEHLRGVHLFDPRTEDVEKLISNPDRLDAFAQFDGFDTWSHLVDFWREEHEPADAFDGIHIRWSNWPKELLR